MTGRFLAQRRQQRRKMIPFDDVMMGEIDWNQTKTKTKDLLPAACILYVSLQLGS